MAFGTNASPSIRGFDVYLPGSDLMDVLMGGILQDGRAVFNIAGNKYRLVVWINYPYRIVYVRFIGTHAEYDKVDVQRI